MKKVNTLIIAIAIAVGSFAQAPRAFRYQAVARDEAGIILVNNPIGLRISIVEGNQEESTKYVEIHNVISNLFGIINFVIGEGDIVKGNFDDIDWGENSYYIRMEMDVNGGDDYKEMGASQLYAVPYALYAEEAGSLVSDESGPPSQSFGGQSSGSGSGSNRANGTPNTKFPVDDDSYLNVNAGSVGIGTTDPGEKVDVVGRVNASEGYKIGGNDGLTAGVNMITDVDFDNDKVQKTGVMTKGGILTHVCGDSLVDTRDGKKYGTVLIGSQCWMSQNMNIGSMVSSGSGGQKQTNNGSFEKFCFNDDPAQCVIYGGMYEWYEAVQYVTTEGTQGICPDGWHITTDDEWKILEGTVDNQYGVGDPEWEEYNWRGSDAGDNLKTTSGWSMNNGTNLFGFSALPAGRRDQTSGNFYLLTSSAYFWLSQNGTSAPPFRSLSASQPGVKRNGIIFHYEGYSVRCLKN